MGSATFTDAHKRCVLRLLEAGADPSARSGIALYAPIVHAARAGHTRAVHLLIEHGAEVDFEATCALGRARRVRADLATDRTLATTPRVCHAPGLVLERPPIYATAGSRLGRHHLATQEGLLEVARLLLAAGAQPCRWDQSDGRSQAGAALEAASQGNAAMLALLIDHGADPAFCLSAALHSGRPEALAVLARHPLDLSRVVNPRFGTRLVHQEVHQGRPKNTIWLVKHGADPNARDALGQTPLFYGARRRLKPEWFAELEHLGARLDVSDHAGHTLLDEARRKRRPSKRLVQWLTQRLGNGR